MTKRAILFLTLFLVASNVLVAQDSEDKARFAAEQWIVLVDDGQYDQSWKEAAKAFQDTISSSDWEKKVSAQRTQLGSKESRKLKEIKSTNAAKGLPAGQYVLVRYQSSYEKKKAALETITAVREGDGQWRVIAYEIN